MREVLREKILALRRQSPAQLFTLKELVHKLKVEYAHRRMLLAVLDEMEAAGVIYRVKRAKYAFAQASRTLVGRLELHPRGFGFVRPEEGGGGDVFVGPHSVGYATHGDRVIVEVVRRKERSVPRNRGRISERGGRPGRRQGIAEPESVRGRIVQVLERANERVIGRVFHDGSSVCLRPLDDRLPFVVQLRGGDLATLPEDAVVEAGILIHPGRYTPAIGRLLSVVGLPGEKDLPLKIILCKYGIPRGFSSKAMAEAASLMPDVPASRLAGRRDFRSWPTVTIDGETARDFDDAVSLEELADGTLLLGVHIADVSHYVVEGSELDREAYLRGNSVYFPDRAVPMLPPQLSSGICSLNPGVDRLVFSVLMRLTPMGGMRSFEFARGVINSKARMTYTSVARILLEKDPVEREKYRELVPLFERMQRLCLALQQQRRSRGAIDLDLPEAEVLLDESGNVENVVKGERNLAHQVIEEFMILANETVAGFLERHGHPALYRIHEAPDPMKVREFAETLRLYGFSLQVDDRAALPRDFQQLSDRLRQSPNGGFLSYLMLRSFALARYSEANIGHFGLASPCYTHFTSPIRRYADLVVHRLLSQCLVRPDQSSLSTAAPGRSSLAPAEDDESKTKARYRPEAGSARLDSDAEASRQLEKLQQIAAQTSKTERIAADAEREAVDYYRALLLSRRLGEECEGFICNVISTGFFVQLAECFAEGFVPAAFLDDDYYVFRQEIRALVGRGGKRMFRLGDRVRVVIDNVDLDMRRILFSLA